MITATLAAGYYGRGVGQKQYELVDHLGNVRALVSDVKQADEAVASTYKPSLLAYSNYYPSDSSSPAACLMIALRAACHNSPMVRTDCQSRKNYAKAG